MISKGIIVRNIIILTLLAIVLIGIVFGIGISKKTDDKLPNSHDDLLVKYSKQINIENLYKRGGEISSVATKYSILYKNNNRRTMYVSSMPLRSIDDGRYSFVDKKIIDEDGYFYTQYDGKTIIYDREGITLKHKDNYFKLFMPDVVAFDYGYNIDTVYGNFDGIKYTHADGTTIFAIPSYNGITITYIIGSSSLDIAFPIDVNNYTINNDYYGSILLSDKTFTSNNVMQNNYFVISQPIVQKNDKKIEVKRAASIQKNELKFSMSKEEDCPVSVTFSVNFYCENMFFDCAAFKQYPSRNHIFDNYIVYEAGEIKETINYMKFNIRSFTPKRKNLLDSVTLNLYILYCSGDIDIEVYSVRNDWCSWELTWMNQPAHNEKIGEFKVSDSGWYSIDLTKYAKLIIDKNYYNLENNSILFKVKDGTSGYAIFTSTDNSMFPPFFVVNYRVEK